MTDDEARAGHRIDNSESSVFAPLAPPRTDVPIAASEDGHYPFHVTVQQFAQPLARLNPYGGQRYCGACSALIESHAACEVCGVEEDPSTWKMGPPQILYTALAISLNFQFVPLVNRWPTESRERALRQYFEGRVERWEASLGERFHAVDG